VHRKLLLFHIHLLDIRLDLENGPPLVATHPIEALQFSLICLVNELLDLFLLFLQRFDFLLALIQGLLKIADLLVKGLTQVFSGFVVRRKEVVEPGDGFGKEEVGLALLVPVVLLLIHGLGYLLVDFLFEV
jgi:hypothetical protein